MWVQCVGCELGTKLLRIMKAKRTCHVDHGRTEAARRRSLTAEAPVRSCASYFGVCGGQLGTGTGFSPSTSVLLRHYPSDSAAHSSPAQCYLSEGQAGEFWQLSKKINVLSMLKSNRQNTIVGPGYNDIDLYDNPSKASNFLWYQLIPHC
jgi:hypothetical protein